MNQGTFKSLYRHENKGLFADYYLNEIVPTLPGWDDELLRAGQKAFDELRALRQRVKQPESLDEAQLEEQWIKPVLDILGHQWAVQVKIRYRDKGYRKPDYVFCRSADDVEGLTGDIYDELPQAVAVGDAKKWGIPLDRAGQQERNPSQQIDEYLRYSNVTWGILTDGQTWRLYHRDSSKYNVYYAVNLETLLQGNQPEKFLYFYAFFRQEAFTGDWLKRVLDGSEEFAQDLSDKLEDAVYESLELMVQGFLEHRRNKLKKRLTAEKLQLIYEESLVLLYRLLFVFYAESREILPLHENSLYTREHSLMAIKKDVAGVLDAAKPLSEHSGIFYASLSYLFLGIDSGDALLDIPAYNGRLFSDDEHPFLDENSVGDFYLAPALDKLARVEVANGRQNKRVFVDYRDLEVRHLGAIYEKLLEYELDITTEALTLKGQQYAVAKDGDAVVKKRGEVYLRTGNNERKITGSYYTPDYIVRFIVEKTLEPLLMDITARHAELDGEGQWTVHDPAGLIREVLALNILDPATGSGHFVVDATAYMAEWLRELGLRPVTMRDDDELVYWKRLIAGACIYAVDINPLAVELAKLSLWLSTLAKGKPLSFLDHHIRAGNSLVGASLADINGEALSVQDEVRREKSLARQRRQEQESGQMSMFADAAFTSGVQFAVAQMNEIEGTVPDDVEDVKRQEELYAALKERLKLWERVADVWTARYFGLELKDALDAPFGKTEWEAICTEADFDELPPYVRGKVRDARQVAADYHFLHWELAFPEIFFDEKGQPLANPGFDAVIGNPPYVRQERIQAIKPYLERHYGVYSGTADLFLYFYERGLDFVKAERRLGYITSGTYMNSNSAKAFRQYIHDNAGLEWVLNFGENQPFRGAEMVYPTIAILKRGEEAKKDTFRNFFLEGTVPFLKLGESVESAAWVDSDSDVTGMDEWRFQARELTALFNSLSQKTTLAEVVGDNMYRGITTGADAIFIVDTSTYYKLIDEHPSSQEILKPLVVGSNLRPWYQINTGNYLIFTQRGIDIENYPAIKNYLEKFRVNLEPRPNNWDNKEDGVWAGRKPGTYQWYEIQDSIAYSAELNKPKILWSTISKLPRFSFDAQGLFTTNSAYLITSSRYQMPALLAVLQSRVSWYWFSQVAIPLRLRAGLWQYKLLKQYVERLPIPELTREQESRLSGIAEEITDLAKRRYQVHEDFRRVVSVDFGNRQAISTRVGLYEWWTLADVGGLNGEIQRVFRRGIPLKKRAEWRDFLANQKSEHEDLTGQIVDLETRLNGVVYEAFGLTAAERALIEAATKYPYGAV